MTWHSERSSSSANLATTDTLVLTAHAFNSLPTGLLHDCFILAEGLGGILGGVAEHWMAGSQLCMLYLAEATLMASKCASKCVSVCVCVNVCVCVCACVYVVCVSAVWGSCSQAHDRLVLSTFRLSGPLWAYVHRPLHHSGQFYHQLTYWHTAFLSGPMCMYVCMYVCM